MRKSIQLREEECLEKMMAYANEAGFSEIAIGFGSSDIFAREDYERAVDKIRNMLEIHDLVCRQTHLPCYHLLISSEETQEAMEKTIIRCIEASAMLGAEWTAYHPRTSLTDGYNRTTSYKTNQEALSSYLEYAEKYGVGIAVENMPLYPYIHPEWRFFGGGWEELCELCDSFDTDKIGICWDFGHAHTASLDQTLALKDIGNRLKITHVHDNYRNGDHHQLPGLGNLEDWGCIDWAKTMQAVKTIDYNGPMTLELIIPPEPMTKSFVQCGYDSLCYLENLKNT